jgi:Ca-activated chloride channel homolog
VSFIWPQMLAALALVPLGIWAYVAIGRRRRERVASTGSLGLGSTNAGPGSRLRDRVPPVLFVAALAILAVALARPQAAVSLPRSEGTLILTFDVSGSMSADDVEPTRLEVAKDAARTLVAERPAGVVIGVVAFSDAGLSVQVPTADPTTLQEAIDRLDPALGTSLGQGILASLDAIARVEAGTPAEYYSDREPEPSAAPAPVEPGSHSAAAIVLLSDGENTVPPDPATVAQTAADLRIRIHTVGVGSTSGTTLDFDGFVVHTQLDEATLRHVAEVTDGSFHQLDPGVGEVATAVDPSAIYDSLGRQLVIGREHIEITSLLAGAAILLLATGTVLSLALSGRLP